MNEKISKSVLVRKNMRLFLECITSMFQMGEITQKEKENGLAFLKEATTGNTDCLYEYFVEMKEVSTMFTDRITACMDLLKNN